MHTFLTKRLTSITTTTPLTPSLFSTSLKSYGYNYQYKIKHKYPSSPYNPYSIKQSIYEQTQFNKTSPLHIRKRPVFSGRNRQAFWEEIEGYKKSIPHMVNPKQDNIDLKTIDQEIFHELKTRVKVNVTDDIINNNAIKETRYMPDAGDKIEIEYFLSLSIGKLNTFKGLVIKRGKMNTIHQYFTIVLVYEGELGFLKMKYFSPLLKSVKLIVKCNLESKEEIFDYKNVRNFGHKNNMILRGGKSVKFNKASRQELKDIIDNSDVSERVLLDL